MALDMGATFAGYRIIRLLGSGGMGEVYLAEHPRLPRRDAVKILSSATCADDEFRERFGREARLAAALFHPHVVGVHDCGEYQGQLWISFDYVDGPDAAGLMRGRYPAGMPAVAALEVLAAVASALDHAHLRGLLHRDVKPANILLTDDTSGQRRIMLADFGIARSLTETSGLTATNVALGTVDYVAPEQLSGGLVDGRADQYSLAATAFHLLTGTPPYQDAHPAVTISRHLTAEPPSLSRLRPELAALDAPMCRAMAKDPEQRFSSCQEFVDALAAAASAGASAKSAAAPANPAVAPANSAAAPANSAVAGASSAPTQRAVTPAAPAAGVRAPGNPVRLVAAATALVLIVGAVVLSNIDSAAPAQQSAAPSTITQTVSSPPPAPVTTTAPAATTTASAPPHTTTVTETITATPEPTREPTRGSTPVSAPWLTPTDSPGGVTVDDTGTRRVPAPVQLPSAAVGVRTGPDAALITSAGWNTCTRAFTWYACVQAARAAAGAPWGGGPPLTADGTWSVPQMVRYGDYVGAVGPMGRCSWTGYDALGRLVDHGMFEHSGSPTFASVSPTMTTFQTFGCTPWFRVAPLN